MTAWSNVVEARHHYLLTLETAILVRLATSPLRGMTFFAGQAIFPLASSAQIRTGAPFHANRSVHRQDLSQATLQTFVG